MLMDYPVYCVFCKQALEHATRNLLLLPQQNVASNNLQAIYAFIITVDQRVCYVFTS